MAIRASHNTMPTLTIESVGIAELTPRMRALRDLLPQQETVADPLLVEIFGQECCDLIVSHYVAVLSSKNAAALIGRASPSLQVEHKSWYYRV